MLSNSQSPREDNLENDRRDVLWLDQQTQVVETDLHSFLAHFVNSLLEY